MIISNVSLGKHPEVTPAKLYNLRKLQITSMKTCKQKERIQLSFLLFPQGNLLNCGPTDPDWLNVVGSAMHYSKPHPFMTYIMVATLLL